MPGAKLLSLTLVSVSLLIGCGKYVAPLPPERFAPRKVSDVQLAPSEQGVTFRWRAPEKNARGQELQEIDGYRVYRRAIEGQSDIEAATGEFELLSFVPDTHIVDREKLRAEARAKGKPARRVDVDAKRKEFQFSDTSLMRGRSYLYQIVPVNQGGVETKNSDQIIVVFNGLNSKVSKVEALVEEEEESPTNPS